ncbi:MAG: LytTR family DNA-binding domain-containing protein [Bacteroidota bacterium]|nr:LytTR family DNA-binding domain-containing protein [Bacteroidota bacterium]MDP4246255.1 LytTR family DNA-binding domain-containing protein [Bacteroidota bacterium]MDP4256527.1 LytTR family DNA-binding domain-containing protein [Bacteroidota bacterium]MDP4259827.1 LytTR family DNA-binding domain-containing protein [Bacteroidota bacterium]
MKLRCILVDDEPPALNVLQTYAESMDNMQVVGQCRNAFEAMQALQQGPVDLIFLDIKMPRLLGTDFLRTLRHPPKVIFTTAYKDFAVEGFELDAVDYLLKPFSLQRFIRAVNKILADGADGGTDTGIEAGPSGAPFLYFRVDRKMVKVNLDEIMYIEGLKDYIRIVRDRQKPLIVKKSMSSVEEMLPAHLFVRIHRSFIVAVGRINAFTQHDVEIDGIELPIGRVYGQQVGKLAGR